MKNDLITIMTTAYYPNSEQGKSRADMAVRVVDSWFEHLKYNGPFAFHLSDDGSGIDYNIDPNHSIPVSMSRQDRGGIGASLNKGFKRAFENSPLVMFIVDDLMFMEDVDLNPWVKLLDYEEIGMIRIGMPHPEITGKVAYYNSKGIVLVIDRHHFAFSFRPFLVHKRFFDKYGWFEEGINALECERIYNLKYCQTAGPNIVYAFTNPWEHKGILELADIEPK